MRKTVTVLSVAVRSSLYKILLILVLMAALQIELFYYTYDKYAFPPAGTWKDVFLQEENYILGQFYGITWTLESLVERSNVEAVFLGAFVLISLVLAWSQSERKGVNSYYFYERLTVSHQKRFVVWSIYNICCMLFLVFVQVLTVWGMGWMFKALVPSEYNFLQMYFMAFYKSEFLHSLLPLSDVIKCVRNLLIFSACSMEIAAYACVKRKSWTMLLMIALIVFGFSQKIAAFGMMDTVLIIASVVCMGVSISMVRSYEPGKES